MGANLHPRPLLKQHDRRPGPHCWAWPHLVCQRCTEAVPHRDCAGVARVAGESPVADAGGPGDVAELWGSNIHPWPLGKQLEMGPDHKSGPGQTWGVSSGRGRFTIRAIQRLSGWVKRVLRQIKVGLGFLQSCGWQISNLGHSKFWGNG